MPDPARPLSPEVLAAYADPDRLSTDPATPAEPRRSHTPIHALLAAMGGSAAADIATTHQALREGRGQEGNPLYGDNPSLGRLVAVKSAGMVPAAFMLDRLYNHHPKTSLITAGLLTALQTGIAAHNARAGR